MATHHTLASRLHRYLAVLSLFVCVSCLTVVTAQSIDNNWVIMDQQVQTSGQIMLPSPIFTLPAPTTRYLNISGLTAPQAAATTVSPAIACNDFFVIFDDGSYSTTRSSTCTLPNSTNPAPGTETYSIPIGAGKKITHLYITDRYEEDENPDALTTSNTSAGILLPTSPQAYIAHQNISNGKDMTVILDDRFLQSAGMYELCHNAPTSYVVFSPAALQPFTGSNALLFDNQGTLDASYLDFMPSASGSSCLTFTTTTAGSTAFINFNCNAFLPGENQQVNFTLFFDSGTEDKPKEEVRVQGLTQSYETITYAYNDPNYTELLCVWQEDDGRKYAKYHVECFNDGPNEVYPIDLQLMLPPEAILSTVELRDWMARCRCDCGTVYPKILNNGDPNLLTVRFTKGVDGYDETVESCNYTAWVEFVVELHPTTDLIFGDLQPSNQLTLFDETMYDIIPYYDQQICYNEEMIDNLRDPYTVLPSAGPCTIPTSSYEGQCILGRPLGSCDTRCPEISWWSRTCKRIKYRLGIIKPNCSPPALPVNDDGAGS